MAHIYVDFLYLEDKYSINPDTLNYKKDSVLAHYNISFEEYKNTFKSFKHDQDLWKEFFDKSSEIADSNIKKTK